MPLKKKVSVSADQRSSSYDAVLLVSGTNALAATLGVYFKSEMDNPFLNPHLGQAGVDFFTVATHELGHSLGLSHSPVVGSIMFPYYKGFQRNLNLDYDDILAMYQLYSNILLSY